MIDLPVPGRPAAQPHAADTRPTLAQLLAGRVLYQENARYRPRVRKFVDPHLSGVVMTGPKADDRAGQLRSAGYRGVLLIDSAAYMTHIATTEEPFLLPQDLLFATLDDRLDFQRAAGADAALTPTGYIPAAASKVLKAVIEAAKRIEREDVIVVLPIDIAWLNAEHIKQLIAACNKIRQPKAVILTGQFDPLEAFNQAPANLRSLVSEARQVALLRTDLAALDAMAYGALFTGIGAGTSIRHAVPVGERAKTGKSGGGPPFPTVLVPELMRFCWGPTLADRYANAEPIRCDCPACQGRGLDRFTSSDGEARIESEDHNAYVWGAWVNAMAACTSANQRRQWWRDRCAQALDRYPLENVRIQQLKAFTPPKPLKAWASLPIDDGTPPTAAGARSEVSSAVD